MLITANQRDLTRRLHELILLRGNARDETAAYVAATLLNLRASSVPFGSIVLAYHDAIAAGRFELFQGLADGVLISEVAFPGWLTEREVCISLARNSYAACWRHLRGEWDLFLELADCLPSIVKVARAGMEELKQTGL